MASIVPCKPVLASRKLPASAWVKAVSKAAVVRARFFCVSTSASTSPSGSLQRFTRQLATAEDGTSPPKPAEVAGELDGATDEDAEEDAEEDAAGWTAMTGSAYPRLAASAPASGNA